MSNPVPSSLALTSIGVGAPILSADHRTNYAAVQAAVNALITALSGGVAGQVLQAASSTAVQYAYSGGLYRKSTSKTVNNTVTDTDLLNAEITVGAAVLGSNGVARLTAWGDWLQQTGVTQSPPRFKVKLGAAATVVIDTGTIGAAIASAATRGGWRICVEIMNLGATNSQMVNFLGAVSFNTGGSSATSGALTTGEGAYANAGGNSFGVMPIEGFNTSAIDTTAAMAVVLSVINATASASYETKLLGALLEVV